MTRFYCLIRRAAQSENHRYAFPIRAGRSASVAACRGRTMSQMDHRDFDIWEGPSDKDGGSACFQQSARPKMSGAVALGGLQVLFFQQLILRRAPQRRFDETSKARQLSSTPEHSAARRPPIVFDSFNNYECNGCEMTAQFILKMVR
jgi:hypothetical protein